MKTRGYTLVELMIVIAIIGVLALAITPNAFNLVAKAEYEECFQNRQDIQSAERLYIGDRGVDDIRGLNVAEVSQILFKTGYLDRMIECPEKGTYSYYYPIRIDEGYEPSSSFEIEKRMVICTEHPEELPEYRIVEQVPSEEIPVIYDDDDDDGSEWQITGKTYNKGDIVTYKGIEYECLQTHTTYGDPNWAPDIARALWKKVESSGDDEISEVLEDSMDEISTAFEDLFEEGVHKNHYNQQKWAWNRDGFWQSRLKGIVNPISENTTTLNVSDKKYSILRYSRGNPAVFITTNKNSYSSRNYDSLSNEEKASLAGTIVIVGQKPLDGLEMYYIDETFKMQKLTRIIY